jgi:hypothetical protein
MHFHRPTECAPRYLGKIILGAATEVTPWNTWDVSVDYAAVTGLFPPADAVEALQSRVVLLVY